MKSKPKHAHRIKTDDFEWLNVTKNTPQEINWLRKTFNFHDIDLKDCLPPNQRPKIMAYDEYLFMVLLFPVYNRKTREIKSAEVDFFIGQNYLVTVHDSQLPPLREFFTACAKDKEFTQKIIDEGPANLLYEIMNRLFIYCFPMLVHINNDIDKIESQIFSSHGPAIIQEIALIKKNIVNFRKAMQAHKNVIHRLVESTGRFWPNLKLDVYFKDLLEQTKEIWDLLENNRDTINALHETRMSLSSYRLNQIIKTLTIISVIFMPINLTAFLFGMETPHPFMNNPLGFWIISGLMAIIAITLTLIFKKKGWW